MKVNEIAFLVLLGFSGVQVSASQKKPALVYDLGTQGVSGRGNLPALSLTPSESEVDNLISRIGLKAIENKVSAVLKEKSKEENNENK